MCCCSAPNNQIEYRKVKLGRIDRRPARGARGSQERRCDRRERRAARASRRHGDAAARGHGRRRRGRRELRAVDEYLFVLHRAADICDGARHLDHGGRSARHAESADQRISGNRAANRGGQRPISGSLAEDHRRNGDHAARAADQRRGKRDLHEFHGDSRRHFLDHGDLQARHGLGHRAGANPEPRGAGARRACPMSCASSAWSRRSARPT